MASGSRPCTVTAGGRDTFRPDADLIAVRTLLRHRTHLIKHRSPPLLHMQKALLQMNLHLSQVVSDVTGETGRRIIRAIVAGEHTPYRLAALRHDRCQKDDMDIAHARTGTWREEPLVVHTQSLALFDFSTAHIRLCDTAIERTSHRIRPDGGETETAT